MINEIKEIYDYRSMLWSLILSELRTRYKGSVLGFMWTFLNPLLMLIVYTLVFSTVMKIRMNNYSVFLFIGLLAWNMFATTVQSASGVIVRQSSLVNKIYFPRLVLPLSVAGGSLLNYFFSLVILIPYLLIKGYYPSLAWIYFPISILFLMLVSSGLAMLASAITVYFRDLEHIIGILMQLLFYLTPIVYSLDMVSSRLRQVFKLNPVADVILSLQSMFYYRESPHWKLFVYGGIISVLIFIVGWKVFIRLSRRFAEEV
jgi:ABC-2 type transport system permease protein